jgi:hypothetical protein
MELENDGGNVAVTTGASQFDLNESIWQRDSTALFQ